MKKLLILGFLALFGGAALAEVDFSRTEDIVYGRKHGVALTLDVFQPEKTNGLGVLFMVSGGWLSAHEFINPRSFETLLARGYTVFAVVHGSQPKYIITEIVPDIHRAVRYVRKYSKRWGIDPNHLGICGGSAGGHLSLTMGTQGGPGKADAQDAVDRESSAVQCVACFFPPTDFLNWGKPGEDAVGVGILEPFQPAFGPETKTAESRQTLGKKISPFYYVTTNSAPTLIIHGDADKLVPIYQARIFGKKCEECKVPFKLEVREGKQHGWVDIDKDMGMFADWFDKYLKPKP